MKVALIGLGHWGSNILRVLKSLPEVEVITIDPLNKDATYANLGSVKEDIDAVFIATPADTHYALALECLSRDWHVFAEKPITKNIAQAEILIGVAKKRNKVLFVDHQFLYNGGILKAKEEMEHIGKLHYIYSRRLKLGKVRDDTDTLWTFAPHDISIFNYLVGEMPISVNCTGWRYNKYKTADVAFMSLQYPNNVNCHLQVSWLDYQKVRDVMICGAQGAVYYDDVIQSFQAIDSTSHRKYIALPKTEPLAESIKHFLDCCKTGKQPRTDGKNGLDIVRILEAASDSMQNNGERREIK